MTTQRIVKKNLAGQEDILYGEDTVVQGRAGGNFVITKVRNIQPVNSIAELDALDVSKFVKARLYSNNGTPPIDYEYIVDKWVQITPDLNPATVNEMLNNTGYYAGLKGIKTKEYSTGNGGSGVYDAVLTSSITPNPFNILTSIADPTISFVLRNPSGFLDIAAWGPFDVADASTIMQSAETQFVGVPQHWPAGTFPMQTQIVLDTASASVFNQGPQIIGAGIGLTVFDNQVSSGPLFDIIAGGTPGSNFLMGCTLRNFKIIRSTSETDQIAIRLRTSYQVELELIHIDGMTGTGIQIPTSVGDNDGSNMVNMKNCRIENCTGWGIDSKGDPGFNEFSFFHMEMVFIQNCGTTSAAATPPSGGMRHKGQIMTMNQCAFTLNQNCALFIPGEAGLAQTVDIQDTTFENNLNRNILCTGISAFKARNLQQYHNNDFIGITGIEFDGAVDTIRQIDIDGCVVRATEDNNAFTAFKISGANVEFDTCRVKRVVWDFFDFAGQTRFDGWQFDHVVNTLDFVVAATTLIELKPCPTRGRGNKIPLRLTGGQGGSPSTTGEWVEHQVANAGISINNSGLTASTRYYCYLYDNNGVATLELSTTAFVTDVDTGYPVKIGDATRYFVGSVLTDGGSLFEITATGWLNPRITFDGPQTGVPIYRWAETTTVNRMKYAVAPTSNTDGTVY